MKHNKNATIKKNTAQHLAPGERGWHAVPGEGVLKEKDLMGTPSSPLQGTSPARREVNHGFTLIELLVVVLIIGILAAVAVPQYQKAVTKARFAEAVTNMNALWKACEIHALQHGVPDCSVSDAASLDDFDIEIPGTKCTVNGFSCIDTQYFRYTWPSPSGLPVAYYNPQHYEGNDITEFSACLFVNEQGQIGCDFLDAEGEKICEASGVPVAGGDEGWCW